MQRTLVSPLPGYVDDVIVSSAERVVDSMVVVIADVVVTVVVNGPTVQIIRFLLTMWLFLYSSNNTVIGCSVFHKSCIDLVFM